ncbi:hypothetical protein PTKIN_Ptkin15bG0067100 [Pterospermum kingtungense]
MSETLLQVHALEKIKLKCNMQGMIGVSANGRSGRISLMWKEEVQINLLSYSKNHIDVEITDLKGREWRMTGVYGELDTRKRHETWSLLRNLSIKALKDARLEDLGFKGRWFTWQRGNTTENLVKERLDRAVATQEWSQIFPAYMVTPLPSSRSDHCPVCLDTEGNTRQHGRRARRGGFFEAMWIKDAEYERIVSEEWAR